MNVKEGQSCGKCVHCDGFACLKLDVWIDDGRVQVGRGSRTGKNSNYIPIQVYGRKYCPHFKIHPLQCLPFGV